MKNFFKTTICLLVLAGAIAGCSNTIRGVGEDTSHAGHEIQESAD